MLSRRMMSICVETFMRLHWSFGGRRTVSGLAVSVLVSFMMATLLPATVFAMAAEEPSTGNAAVSYSLPGEGLPKEPLRVSELPSSPYIAGQNTDQFRQKANSVAGYIQNYNRRLALDEIGNISQAIVQYSDRYGVDYRLLTSIIAIESSFRRDAVSSSGAIGMGQLKPDTARWLGVLNPYDPVDNIAGTARFLAWLVRRYNGNLEYALSAYYQGPGSVDRNGVTPVCMPYLEKVNRALGPLM
jgi:hypothetical protein